MATIGGIGWNEGPITGWTDTVDYIKGTIERQYVVSSARMTKGYGLSYDEMVECFDSIKGRSKVAAKVKVKDLLNEGEDY